MKHSGKARQAAHKIIGIFSAIVFGLYALAQIIAIVTGHRWVRSTEIIVGVVCLILVFAFLGFTFYFFRDPEARVPAGANLVVSPGHGKVDAIDEIDEPVFMGGRCKRISTFLSVFNVHVQNIPASGQVKYVKHTSGKFLNAMAAESAAENENVLIGIASSERPGQKVGARLIAGLIARRIIPWVTAGEPVARGERMSLIQFGSRVDVYLPLSATINVKLGDKVVGGESVLATLA